MTAAPAADRLALVVDLGTGGPKVGIATLDGRLLWHEHHPVRTRLLDGGGAVQDAAEWWTIIAEVARRGLRADGVDASAVVAVSCTGQYASTVPVDAAGTPVGDCLLWMDTRGAPHARAAFGGPVSGYDPRALARWVRRTGGAPSTTGADPIGHRLFLAAEQPEVLRAARWLLEPVDYLAMRFTGVAAATPASMVAAWLTDNRRADGPVDYDLDLIDRAGLDPHQLPPLRPTGSVLGEVLGQVADELGLPPGVQVVASLPDLHTAALGAGAVLEGQAHLALSTSSWISCPVPTKKTDVTRQIASVPGLTPGGYLVIDNHEVGGLALQWLRDGLANWATTAGAADAEPAGASGPSYEQLTALAATAEPGSGGVIFTPWLNGERSPIDDRHARGGFHNLSLDTTHVQLTRAVLEGVAYNSRWLHEAVERFVGHRLDPVRIVGGGAQSDLWCQIHADVLDRTIERVAQPLHANLRGAALAAGLSLGAVQLAEIAALAPAEQTFRPDPANRAVYDRLYAEFPGLYSSQRSMFRRLNRGGSRGSLAARSARTVRRLGRAPRAKRHGNSP